MWLEVVTAVNMKIIYCFMVDYHRRLTSTSIIRLCFEDGGSKFPRNVYEGTVVFDMTIYNIGYTDSGNSLPTFWTLKVFPWLKMDTYSETSINFYQTTRCHFPEDGYLQMSINWNSYNENSFRCSSRTEVTGDLYCLILRLLCSM
jgi:hypothetical protein